MDDNKKNTFRSMMRKEVINICSGKKLGNIFDAELDVQCNKIIAYLVKEKKIDFCKKERAYRIPVKDIKKIGNEIILVEKIFFDEMHGSHKHYNGHSDKMNDERWYNKDDN